MPIKNGIVSSGQQLHNRHESRRHLDTPSADPSIPSEHSIHIDSTHPNGSNKSLNERVDSLVDEYTNSLIKINGTTTMSTEGGGRRGLRILICTESFHPYTSGIARRFKEIIRRLADRGFLIHIITGCRVKFNVLSLVPGQK
jgi:hypothetical protein